MGRSPCCEKAHTNKGAWTKEEDDRLVAYIRAHGEGCWRSLPKAAGLLRCGKSCRLRWINYLRPDLKRGNFTQEEDELIIKLHSLLGNKWSLIAGRLPGRTDNEIKNYWNTHIRRKLLSRGIDPATHRPLNEPPPTPSISFKHDHPVVSDSNSKSPTSERCPDLNLELTISPPHHDHPLHTPNTTAVNNSACVVCTLGFPDNKDCSCANTSTTVTRYDFLGLKSTVLDYRNLETK
ncbi:hypothetical protein Fmac_000045 [Flemingia macrophylla]|uniref:Uncharacterized protein n=1 Tax=Flemingia macrophylla TaxID=520843 RepID=A0ABD1ND56_9FABA